MSAKAEGETRPAVAFRKLAESVPHLVWTCDGEGICKYTHTDPIQALAFNPVLQTLASVSTTDFGIWMTQGDKVNKTKIPARGCSVDWAPDG